MKRVITNLFVGGCLAFLVGCGGDLPNISRYMIERGTYRSAVSVLEERLINEDELWVWDVFVACAEVFKGRTAVTEPNIVIYKDLDCEVQGQSRAFARLEENEAWFDICLLSCFDDGTCRLVWAHEFAHLYLFQLGLNWTHDISFFNNTAEGLCLSNDLYQ
ncbi:MAG: hypothetical protein IH874_00955 [Candidatus Dadabacteria bacterium]|nr:hypothetical protein [Candidatus Dadabacteria bacterium]